MPVKSRTLAYRAAPEHTYAVVRRYLADALPGIEPPLDLADQDRTWFAAESGEPVPHTISLYLGQSWEEAAGEQVQLTDVTVYGGFDQEPPSTPEGRRAVREVQRRVDELMSGLEQRLQAEAPAEFTRAAREWKARRVPIASVAHNAATAVADPAAFRDLVEKDEWVGTVPAADGTPVEVKLAFGAAQEAQASWRPFSVKTSVRGAALRRIGDARAVEITEATAADLMRRVKGERPRVARLRVSAGPIEVPQLFYEADSTLRNFMERTAGNGDDGTAVVAPEPGVRAELRIDLEGDAGAGSAPGVFVAVEHTTRGITAEDRARWQQAADGIAAAITGEMADSVAPSFSVGVPVEVATPRVRAGLAAMFPSNEPDQWDDFLRYSGVELAEDVYGSVKVSLEPVGEWETRVTFTGDINGSGLGNDPRALAAARVAYRDAIARAAAQMRDELAADLIQLPTRRPDAGLE